MHTALIRIHLASAHNLKVIAGINSEQDEISTSLQRGKDYLIPTQAELGLTRSLKTTRRVKFKCSYRMEQ